MLIEKPPPRIGNSRRSYAEISGTHFLRNMNLNEHGINYIVV